MFVCMFEVNTVLGKLDCSGKCHTAKWSAVPLSDAFMQLLETLIRQMLLSY